jgi:hypothetical protein
VFDDSEQATGPGYLPHLGNLAFLALMQPTAQKGEFGEGADVADVHSSARGEGVSDRIGCSREAQQCLMTKPARRGGCGSSPRKALRKRNAEDGRTPMP